MAPVKRAVMLRNADDRGFDDFTTKSLACPYSKGFINACNLVMSISKSSVCLEYAFATVWTNAVPTIPAKLVGFEAGVEHGDMTTGRSARWKTIREKED
ncbi:hypothetical protein FRB95_008195 [Tulasnella sp. JGI-2019a]|nr:hypothetical protein FRB95_008195 [Tulasnella sp. JGI-2019a]